MWVMNGCHGCAGLSVCNAVPDIWKTIHFLCFLLDASLHISVSCITSTPSAFEVILELTRYINYLLLTYESPLLDCIGMCWDTVLTVHLCIWLSFYHTMLRRAQLCHSMSSVHLSVCLSVTFRYRDHIGWNTCQIAKASARADPNMGNLMQREHPQN